MDKNLALINCEGGKTKYISFCNKLNYDNKLCIQRHILHILKHIRLRYVPTARSSVPTNRCRMSTDTVVYSGTHVVYLQTQHVLDV